MRDPTEVEVDSFEVANMGSSREGVDTASAGCMKQGPMVGNPHL